MPPAALTVTFVLPPLQAIVPAAEVAVKAVGSVMVTEVVVEQPFASVTVKVCVPTLLTNTPVPV